MNDDQSEQRYDPYSRTASGIFVPSNMVSAPQVKSVPDCAVLPGQKQAQGPTLSRQARRRMMLQFAGQQVNRMFGVKHKKKSRKALAPQVVAGLPTEEFRIPKLEV